MSLTQRNSLQWALRRARRKVEPLYLWEGHGWVVRGECVYGEGDACSLPFPDKEEAIVERNRWIVAWVSHFMDLPLPTSLEAQNLVRRRPPGEALRKALERTHMTKILTRDALDALMARRDAIVADYDGDTNALQDRLHAWLTDEVGPYAGTGVPADAVAASDFGGDYVCALDTGECVVWGREETILPGVTVRDLSVR